MALKPEFSIMGGLAVAAIVFAVHSQATPSMADIQALPAGTPDVDDAEHKATIMSAGIVSGVSLIAKDPTIFVLGSAMTIAMALWTRRANWMEGIGGKFLTQPEAAAAGTESTGPAMAQTANYVPFQSDFAR